jgi:hypothetical protein
LWLILLGLQILHCGSEVLNQLQMGGKELLGSRIRCRIGWGRWHWVLLVSNMCSNNRWNVLSLVLVKVVVADSAGLANSALRQ